MNMSPKDRRVLTSGVLVIVLMLLLARGLPGWRRWNAATRASAVEALSAEATAASALNGLGAVVDSAEARQLRIQTLAGTLLAGDSPAEAGATLVSVLTAASVRASAVLGSVEVDADTAGADTFIPITVRGDVSGDLQGLSEMLAYLETAPELLAITELSITQPDAGGATDRAEALQMTITVRGLALAPSPVPMSAGTSGAVPPRKSQ